MNDELERLRAENAELRRVAGELVAALNLVRQLNPNQLPPQGYDALASAAKVLEGKS